MCNLTSRHPELFFEEYELTISNLIDIATLKKIILKSSHNCIKKSRSWKNKNQRSFFDY